MMLVITPRAGAWASYAIPASELFVYRDETRRATERAWSAGIDLSLHVKMPVPASLCCFQANREGFDGNPPIPACVFLVLELDGIGLFCPGATAQGKCVTLVRKVISARCAECRGVLVRFIAAYRADLCHPTHLARYRTGCLCNDWHQLKPDEPPPPPPPPPLPPLPPPNPPPPPNPLPPIHGPPPFVHGPRYHGPRLRTLLPLR